jgi:hypothetical protein
MVPSSEGQSIKALHLGTLARNHSAVMDAHRAFSNYHDLAKAADDASLRTVYMLGMLCAQAVAVGKFVMFAKGSGWPDPRFPGHEAHHYRKTRDR